MKTDISDAPQVGLAPRVECSKCSIQLPLRLSAQDEFTAVWLCASCGVPFVAICLHDLIEQNSSEIRLSDRYFDVSGLPAINPELRQQVFKLVNRNTGHELSNHRRSQRVPQSLVVPAVTMSLDLTPIGVPFNVMVANLSKEGIGLVHNSRIYAPYIAIQLETKGKQPIQAIVRLVRERELESPFFEVGGEFYVRLGDCHQDDSQLTDLS